MARPRKVGLDYFSHDADLSSDDKIEAMEAKYGPMGYAFYLKTLERIYRHAQPVEYPGVFRSIMSGKMRITEEILDEVLGFACAIKLLYRTEDGSIMSRGAEKRISFIEKERESDRNRVSGDNPDSSRPDNPRIRGERKGKETKEKERKEKEDGSAVSDPGQEAKTGNPPPSQPPTLFAGEFSEASTENGARRKTGKGKGARAAASGKNPDILPPVLSGNTNFMAAWNGFLEMRRTIKKPATPRAQDLIIKKLRELSGSSSNMAIQILNQSTTKCWQDVYEWKPDSANSRNSGSRRPVDSVPDLEFIETGT